MTRYAHNVNQVQESITAAEGKVSSCKEQMQTQLRELEEEMEKRKKEVIRLSSQVIEHFEAQVATSTEKLATMKKDHDEACKKDKEYAAAFCKYQSEEAKKAEEEEDAEDVGGYIGSRSRHV